MPERMHTFVRDEILPSWWPNALQAFIGAEVGHHFALTQTSDTTVAVVAGPGDDLVAIAIEGRWRFVESTVTRAHPGGAAGTYDVFVTAADNNIVSTPDPGTDLTNYSFSLAIVAHGGTPSGAVLARKVAELAWSGTSITAITMLVGPAAITPAQIAAASTGDLAGEIAARTAALTAVTADSWVTQARMADNSVGSPEIIDGAVGPPEIAPGAVGATQMADGGVGTAKLAPGAVTPAKLAADVGQVPISAQLPYGGNADPADTNFLLADGRLVDRTTYAAFFAIVGHKYNGGVDPGSNKVRLPDKRGRVTVGADDMGTAQRAANRIPNSNRAAGQNGGEERHRQTTTEMAAHGHPGGTVDIRGGNGETSVTGGTIPLATTVAATNVSALAIPSQGGSTPFNVMQPYEVDNVIVRVR